ncbi:hypothetical protein HELRODRAFT_97843, partial [Helobdella robusta]|uniref:Aminopeptidase P N-terminal domain-containing protein n=1 Tax=Helobdella robusta TaxID=6412 RepID=T1G9J3_HELRO
MAVAKKSTTVLLQRLRSLMKNASIVNPVINGYIVPSGDAHLSEYIAPCDRRREFISGFTGSFGIAVVTDSKAALWTDSRYYLQAEEELDENWTLMKMGLPDTPTLGKWLRDELPNDGRVGVDPFLMSQNNWQELSDELELFGKSLVSVAKNLIDTIWDDRPPTPTDLIFVHPIQYAGEPWHKKIDNLRSEMAKKNSSVHVVSALDEVAWLFNLRGSDVQFNPVFFSYAIITMDQAFFFVDERKLTDDVRQHLMTSAGDSHVASVVIEPYEKVLERLKKIVDESTGANDKIWISLNINHAIFGVVPKMKQLKLYSAVEVAKSVKNEVEVQGMKNCHIRDAVALCEFFTWLEKEIEHRNVTEIEAADYAEACRKKQALFVSLSFDTISSSGEHGAIVHYKPTPETNKDITKKEIYLIDSGAQYRDGTTDVTRTVHFGTPNDYEKECFTSVLKGHIALDNATFPNRTKGSSLDSMARQYLWSLGLNYGHGTGHGVGSFLNVHEGPCGIRVDTRADEIALKKGMVLSDEPGYYEDGKFGVRIENLFVVVDKQTKYNYLKTGYLGFEHVTLVPIQRKMINKDMLTADEVKWLNDYHKKCRDIVGSEAKRQGKNDVYDWIVKETEAL